MRRVVISIFLCLLALTGTAFAQQTTTPAPTAQAEQAMPNDPAAVEALIKVLEDPAQRESLIQFLQNSAAAQGATSSEGSSDAAKAAATDKPATDGANGTSNAEATTEGATEGTASAEGTATETGSGEVGQVTSSVVGAIAGSLQKFGTDLWDVAKRIWAGLSGYQRIVDDRGPVDPDRFLKGLLGIFSIIVPAYIILWVLRQVSLRLFSRLQARYTAGNWLHRSGYLLFSSGVEIIVVIIAAAGAYFVALYISPNPGPFRFNQVETLTLNAFFLIEMARVAIRFVFAPYRPKLRVFPFPDEEAVYWSRHLSIVVAFFGFGVSVFVPLVILNWSYSLGASIRLTVVLLSLLYLILVIWRSRERVQDAIDAYAEKKIQSEIGRPLLGLLAATWHLVAILYIVAMFLVWLSRPYHAVEQIVYASGYTALILVASVLVTATLSKAIRRGIKLPPRMARKLPTMESRLNAFVPTILSLFRTLVVIGAVLGILEVWGLGAFWSWLFGGEGTGFGSRLSSALFVLGMGLVVWVVTMSWIDLRLTDQGEHMITPRRRTLFKLFSNALTILLVVMFSLLALAEIGINIGPLIAGAGVFGLAVSFGSQKLVQDIINGAFIQVENAMNEGDWVSLGGISGTVERLTIRSVRLRDIDGSTHTIPFSAVDTVTNATKDYGYCLAVVGVSYATNINDAKAAMQEAFKRLRDTPNGLVILEDLEMQGVIAFSASSVDIRARIKTLPGSQWSIGRAYNEYIKQVFDERGIEIPFPQVTYHYADDKVSAQKRLPPSEEEREPVRVGRARVDNDMDTADAEGADGDGPR
ncbi:mechanosensitive ion channel domain-containing protein [Pseudovibrio exalbescens]|uniref:mechanosensitive ion channel domain-containing protein n=1 Tax=Pseudovibrio exalbescens TaxID=197461 RepID=UPI0004146A7A|nr:mechanosensitive ion channel domain-containing protein [Pseudovibrio exalbescens]